MQRLLCKPTHAIGQPLAYLEIGPRGARLDAHFEAAIIGQERRCVLYGRLERRVFAKVVPRAVGAVTQAQSTAKVFILKMFELPLIT